ncbi:MAG: hypothetical protein WCX69_00760 [Candidatus Paceibacterota bacterium]
MKKKIILAVLLFLVLLAAGFAVFQFVGGKKGKSVPVEPAPDEQTGVKQSRADMFSDGQIYKVFAADGFGVKYPFWPNVDLTNVPDAGKIKIAVADQGCVFMVKIADIPEGMTFKKNTEKLLDDQAAKISKTLIREIGEDQAHFEGEVVAGNVTMKNVSYTYLTAKNQSAGVAFAANADNFDKVCRPIIDEVVASVSIE